MRSCGRYTNAEGFGFQSYDPSKFHEAARRYCALSHVALLEQHSKGAFGDASLSRLESQCFKAAWIYHVLHDGLGFPRQLDEDPAYVLGAWLTACGGGQSR